MHKPFDGQLTIDVVGNAVALWHGVDTEKYPHAPKRSVRLVIQAGDNTGDVVYGGRYVDAAVATRQGTPLRPNEIHILDFDLCIESIWFDTVTAGSSVHFSYWGVSPNE